MRDDGPGLLGEHGDEQERHHEDDQPLQCRGCSRVHGFHRLLRSAVSGTQCFQTQHRDRGIRRLVRRLDVVAARDPHVVVVGAGFAGLHVVRALSGRPVQVTLVDRHNFHTFLPLLYQVATAGLEPGDVAYPTRAIFAKAANVTVRHDTVVAVDLERHRVALREGTTLEFDHLVLASGAAANYFGIDGASENSSPLYTLADARRLRDELLSALERAESFQDRPGVPLHVVIVGGGPTGIETAGAVAELLAVSLRRDRLRIDPGATKVVLVDTAPRLLGGFPATASSYAIATLQSRGIDVRLDTSVVSVRERGVVLANGETIENSIVIWAAGVTAAGTLVDGLEHPSGPSGRVLVDRDLSIPGHPGAWAVGDAAAIPSGHGDELCPQLAPVAIQSGRHCARQILRTIEGDPTKPFTYWDKGIMATIGRNAAVAKLPHVPLIKGRAGWLAWTSLHLFYLVGFRNRLRVFINWTWRYFSWPSGPRVIMDDREGVPE